MADIAAMVESMAGHLIEREHPFLQQFRTVEELVWAYDWASERLKEEESRGSDNWLLTVQLDGVRRKIALILWEAGAVVVNSHGLIADR